MRHRCETHGCYQDIHVLKFPALAGGLPERMSFTDIDAAIERNGHFLFMEWKHTADSFTVGQGIFFQQLTRHENIMAVDVVGNPRTMECEQLRVWCNGELTDWHPTSLEDLNTRIGRWYERVNQESDMGMTVLGDLMAALGKYNDRQTGEEKTSWGRCGKLFQREDGSMVVKLDMVPIETNGWLAVFEPRDNKPASRAPAQNQGFRGRDAGQNSAPARVESDSRGARPDPRAQQSTEFADEDIPF